MLETERLFLDTLKEKDKIDYFNNISHDKSVLETFICRYEETVDGFDFSRYLNRDDILGIYLKETNKLIGILTIYKSSGDEVEIGYGIGSSYWNKGYTTEAVKEFIKYLFLNRNINTIYASFFTHNIASLRVMQKSHLKFSHIVYNELTYLDKERDLVYYKITKNDFLNNDNK